MPCILSMIRNIKMYLKSVGITQKEFADRIGLSRPTLDSYIVLHENGEQIPKERYEIIFKKLFDSGDKSSEDFYKNLIQVEGLLFRDREHEIDDLEPQAADYFSIVMKNVKNDLKEADWNKDVYVFINILISNYRKNVIFERLVEYFIFLNDIRGVDSIHERQKPYFAKLYRAFRSLKDNPLDFDERDYNEFIHRCNEIHDEKKNEANERRKDIKERIKYMMNEYKGKGVEIDEVELLEEIKNQLLKEKNEE